MLTILKCEEKLVSVELAIQSAGRVLGVWEIGVDGRLVTIHGDRRGVEVKVRDW